MRKRAILLGLALCVLLFTLADRSFSRARPPQTPAQQQRWMQEQQQKTEQLHLKTEQDRLQGAGRRKTAQQEAHKIWEEYSDNEAWPQASGRHARAMEGHQTEAGPHPAASEHAGDQCLCLRLRRGRQHQFGQLQSEFRRGWRGRWDRDRLQLRRRQCAAQGVRPAAAAATSFAAQPTVRRAHRAPSADRVARADRSPVAEPPAAGSGYGFAIGGTGPVKKKVGEVVSAGSGTGLPSTRSPTS